MHLASYYEIRPEITTINNALFVTVEFLAGGSPVVGKKIYGPFDASNFPTEYAKIIASSHELIAKLTQAFKELTRNPLIEGYREIDIEEAFKL